jgi:hypothetical protein
MRKKTKAVVIEFEGRVYRLTIGETFHVVPTIHIEDGDVEAFTIRSRKSFPIKVLSFE